MLKRRMYIPRLCEGQLGISTDVLRRFHTEWPLVRGEMKTESSMEEVIPPNSSGPLGTTNSLRDTCLPRFSPIQGVLIEGSSSVVVFAELELA